MINKEYLEDRRLYCLRARNLSFGVWSAELQAFLGLREKFGHTFIDTEFYRSETGGSAHPIKELVDVVPPGIVLRANLYLEVWIDDGESFAFNPNTQFLEWLKVAADRHVTFARS